ncbi:MAG: endonuclease domain-containing protein [Ignavibacteria bacterium]|jgi:very-short-patch-repair endonuclease
MSSKRLHNRKELKSRRKKLRNNATYAEKHLWKFLKHSQLAGKKFRRQHSIGNYIVDFFCYEENLAVELDGQHHSDKEVIEYDKERTKFLESLGIKVIRFENHEVIFNTDNVLKKIEEKLNKNMQ